VAQVQPVRQPVQQIQQVRQPVQRAAPMQTMETAYASEPAQGKAPRVMFGNMLLEAPKAGQKY